jgi:hypothetical protein
VPSSISKSRLRKAFNEGRRSASVESAENPYDNPKLRDLWEEGRSLQRAGKIETPIPALRRGETRAQRARQNPPRPKRPSRPPGGGGPRHHGGFGGGHSGGYGDRGPGGYGRGGGGRPRGR